jgi:integrase
MMLMADKTPAFCAAQLGHSVGMLLGTYARWLDGAHNAPEMPGRARSGFIPEFVLDAASQHAGQSARRTRK